MTPEKKRTVLIAGAGHLGSRYLQSLTSVAVPLEIHLLSPDPHSLSACADRWADAGGHATHHTVVNHLTSKALPQAIDLVVVSSTADVRVELVEMIATTIDVNYWLVEKVLAQHPLDLERLSRATAAAKGAWVNYYMLSEALYSEVKAHLSQSHPIHVKVSGFEWGLACNGLHFIHLHRWLNDSPINSLREERLAPSWHPAKRPGYWEIYGELGATCFNGAELSLSVQEGLLGYRLLLQDGSLEWEIFEETGVALRSDGLRIACPVAYQSARPLLSDILLTGTCKLPRLQDVLTTDSHFLQLMLDCWRRLKDQNACRVPIT